MTLKLRCTIIRELSSKRGEGEGEGSKYISRFHGSSTRKYHARLRLSRPSRFVSESVFSFWKRVTLKECKLRLISSEILPWMSLFRMGDDHVSTLKHSTDGNIYLCTKIEFHGLRVHYTIVLWRHSAAYSALIRRVLGSLSTEERRAFEGKRASLVLTLLHWSRRTLSDWKEDCSRYTKWESLLAGDDSGPGEDKGVGSGKPRFRQLSKHRLEGLPISQDEKNRKEKNGFVEPNLKI